MAVLVPTTILALQHYRTFSERLKEFPVRIEHLSRAKSTAEVNQILKDVADGRIDILIGTHKILGKNVGFKDLGLLIIDSTIGNINTYTALVGMVTAVSAVLFAAEGRWKKKCLYFVSLIISIFALVMGRFCRSCQEALITVIRLVVILDKITDIDFFFPDPSVKSFPFFTFDIHVLTRTSVSIIRNPVFRIN